MIQLVVCSNRGMMPQFVTCLLNSKHPDIDVKFNLESLISRSRSIAATEFLKSDHEILLFIDDDIVGWDIGTITKIAEDVKEKCSVVGGCYPAKSIPPVLCATALDVPTQITSDSELVEVKYLGAGFMAIPRQVLSELAGELPLVHGYGNLMMYPFFFPAIHTEGYGLSDDTAFCYRCTELGYKLWLDPGIVLGHIGQFEYKLCR